MKKTCIILIITVLLGYLFFLRQPEFNIGDKITKQEFTQEYLKEEEICLAFIRNKLSSEMGGIYTNYLDTDETSELARGHEILSESEGLMMLYYVKKGDKKSFDQHLDFVESKMIEKEGLIKWRIREENSNLSDSSAPLDDLRILRSLIYAYDLWEEDGYYKILKRVSKELLKYNTYEDRLTSYYAAKKIDLCYIDLYTMNLLQNVHKKWKIPYRYGLDAIENGYISDELPLYKKSYDIDSKNYLNNENINIIEALLVVLHLSEINLTKSETIQWIKNQLFYEKGIFSEYNIKTAQAVNKQESTAAYAIIARIAKNIGDEALYRQAMKKMLSLQILDDSSPIYGSFGNPYTYEVFSFDNLQALLAF